jgi:DNA-binding beta-propeller fold protein YncE
VHRDVPDVAVDSKDRVYLITRSDPRVMVYERDGTFVKSWGEKMLRGRSHGITVGPDDSVYCIDDRDYIVYKCTTDGKILMTLGNRSVPSDTGYDITKPNLYEKLQSITHGGPPFNLPTGLAVGSNGDLYVADGYGNCRVHRFSADGKLVQSWGDPGIGLGQFHLPHDIAADANGRIYVADRQNDRVQIFDLDGKFLEHWEAQRPAGLYVDRKGLVYVAELPWTTDQISFRNGVRVLPARLSIFDTKGKLQARWLGDDPNSPIRVSAPHGICADSHGDIYIGEVNESITKGSPAPGSHSLQKFVRQ